MRWNQECHGGPFAKESRSKKEREKNLEEGKKKKNEIKEIMLITLSLIYR